MDPNKNSMLFGMIEVIPSHSGQEKYGTRLPEFGAQAEETAREGDWEVRGNNSGLKSKRKSVLNTIKKIVKFEHPSAGFPTTGSGFIRKWKSNRFGSKSVGEGSSGGSGSGNLEWWEPPQDSLPVEFCQDTSLHGLKYIGQSQRHLSERIFWFLTFAVGLSVAVWLISEMWNKYKMNPVIVSFQPFETNVDQIPFPAVTVCNMNKVMKSKAQEFIKNAAAGDQQAIKDVYYLDHVCGSTQSFSRRFNFTQTGGLTDAEKEILKINETASFENLTRVNQFLRRAAQNCTEMIRLCVWHDVEIDCSLIFRPIETEFGKCCTFNMVPLSLLYTRRNDSRENAEEIMQWERWDIGFVSFMHHYFLFFPLDNDGLLLPTLEDGPQFPRRQMKAGLTNGLSFLLNVDRDEYYCTSSDSIGFRMATHTNLEVARIADFGISLNPKSEVFVDVAPQITMVDQDVFAFSLDKRNCYKTGEYKLAHYKYYSVNNCIDECIANETVRVCGCKRYYMPRTAKEKLCGTVKFECAETVRFEKTKRGIRNTCPLCYQSCTEVNYEPQTTSTPLRDGIWKYSNDTETGWKEDDLSIVHVYIGEDSFYAKVRKELYGPTDLFANTGGLMGLCLGFSGLSLIEVIYFLTLRAWWKSRRRQNVVVTADERPRWADASVTPISTPGASVKRAGVEREEQKPSTAYYRSIFGEIRVEEKKL